MEGDNYFPEGWYEDEDFEGYDYEGDEEMNINLFCQPSCNFHNTSTGYVLNPLTQQRRNINFAGVSPISTDTNDCVVTLDLLHDTSSFGLRH